MLSVSRPTDRQLSQFLAASEHEELTYPNVGATRGELPAGWSLDDRGLVIGEGELVFDRGCHALQKWTQFDLDWVWPLRTDVPIQTGNSFAFVAYTVGVWSINVCRVVYVVDESDEHGSRFGFAYGTVNPHAVRGEERFWLEWNRQTDQVTFAIRKFSRPANLMFALMGPVTRSVQRRFTVEALQRLAQEVAP